MTDQVLAQLRREDFAWRIKFADELKALGVPGSEIGAALNETDQFCEDSGLWHPQAFGDPAEYAQSLGLAPSDLRLGKSIVDALPTTLQLLGFGSALIGAIGFSSRNGVVLQWGLLAMPVLYLIVTVTRSDYLKQQRLHMARRWLKILGFALALAAFAAIVFQGGQDEDHLIRIPAWLLAAPGMLLALAGSLWAQFGLPPKEAIVSPTLTPEAMAQARKSMAWRNLSRNWGFTVTAAALTIFLLILSWF